MKNFWYYVDFVMLIILIGSVTFILLEKFPLGKNYDREFCYLYADEKVGEKSWVQHDYYLIKEMQKEAKEYYNISYNFYNGSISWKKMLFIQGDGHTTSWTFNPETKEPITATCSFNGFIQEGDIRHEFKIIKEVNISDLKNWRKQYD